MTSLHDSYHRPLFPRGPGFGLKTLLMLALALSLLFYDVRGQRLQGLRHWGAAALTPVVWAAELPPRLWHSLGGIDSKSSLERDNQNLRQQQFVLQAQLQRLQGLEAENRRLRELLASTAQLPEAVLVAEIVNVSQDPYRHQIMLNRGSSDGVYRGQAVVDAYGVMGQIVEVAAHSAKALLVTDPDHGVPIEINRTGLQTIALGLGDERGLRLPFLPSNADIKAGDLLVSSSLGGRFPAGYPVGTVYEVKPVAGEHFMEAYAYPAAKLNQGRQALLVWNRNGAPASEEPAAEPAASVPAKPAPAPATKPLPAAAPAAKPAGRP
ncbi:rod shape-determining protein MreC [Solimonas aquatica]|uniref:Cell shape-determining protein MreC n=1 Tax=Solimonas aquatica TaxID=489703 RepID=A0A1H9BXU3_9GAMM|nr:rod shape-determining protein MreC [Solimonas aquatica]SEP93722.1 rod shape-determining protein MreC [Solimonas aquatica]